MKLSRLLVLIGFLAIFAMATHMSIDSDTWWHLRSGQWMIENRSLITEDPFSYTRGGEPWQYPGLWVQVMMFLSRALVISWTLAMSTVFALSLLMDI